MSVLDYIDEAYDYQIEPQQRLMLEALVLRAPRDKESFSHWLAGMDLDAMDYPTLRLCSPLLRKFGGALAQTPYYERMKGIYRYFHLRNTLIASGRPPCPDRNARRGNRRRAFQGYRGLGQVSRKHGHPANDRHGCPDTAGEPPASEELLRSTATNIIIPKKKKSTDVHSHDYINAARSALICTGTRSTSRPSRASTMAFGSVRSFLIGMASPSRSCRLKICCLRAL
jgi:hypothetical protein